MMPNGLPSDNRSESRVMRYNEGNGGQRKAPNISDPRLSRSQRPKTHSCQSRLSFAPAKSANERPFHHGGFAIQSATLSKRRLEPRKRIRLRIVFLDDRQAAFAEDEGGLPTQGRVQYFGHVHFDVTGRIDFHDPRVVHIRTISRP